MPYLRVLGGAILETGGTVVSGPAGRRHPLALLALLATAPARTLSRGKLIGLLWPDSPEKTARNRLNTCAHQVRKALGKKALLSSGDDLRLSTEALGCDVWEFQEALEAGEHERAVELYRGPYLDGFRLGGSAASFEKRVDQEQARLRHHYREALEVLAEMEEARNAPEAAAAWWRRRANEDPYDSRVILRLMGAETRAGNRAAAIQVAQVHALLLQEEIGTEASPEVRELADRLRSAPEGGATEPSWTTPNPPRSPPAVEEGKKQAPTPGNDRDTTDGGEGGGTRPPWIATVLAMVLLAAGTLGWYLTVERNRTELSARLPTLAVLPFEEIGGEDPTGITEGLHADLLTRLAKIGGLHVVSGTSVKQYRQVDANLAQIARDLGVRWILEGAVQRTEDELQVNVQLVDSRTDGHVWAETYRLGLSTEALFDIQAHLTRQIARALQVRLPVPGERDLARRPTDDLEAYEFFLQGRAHETRPPGGIPEMREGYSSALRLFERAVERDPEFSEAWARKALAHQALYQLSGTEREDHLEAAWTAAQRASELEPDGPVGHLALAELYRGSGNDLERAMEHYEATGLGTSEVLMGKAKVRQREGRLEEAIVLYERARALDPRNHGVIFQSWWAYGLLRRYDGAAEVLDRVLELAPEHRPARLHRARLPLLRSGAADSVGPAVSWDPEVRWRLGDHRGALAPRFPERLDPPIVERGRRLQRGLILGHMGDSAAARATLDSVRVELEVVVERDSVPQELGRLGLANAGLGHGDAALEAVWSALRRAENDGDPLLISTMRKTLAIAQTLLGQEEEALETLEEYLAHPGLHSFQSLTTRPILERLQAHPAYPGLERRFGS